MRWERFIGDPSDFSPIGEEPVPHTITQLLGILRLRDAPEDVQHQAIAEWLTTHEPSPNLTFDLTEHGLLGGTAAR